MMLTNFTLRTVPNITIGKACIYPPQPDPFFILVIGIVLGVYVGLMIFLINRYIVHIIQIQEDTEDSDELIDDDWKQGGF